MIEEQRVETARSDAAHADQQRGDDKQHRFQYIAIGVLVLVLIIAVVSYSGEISPITALVCAILLLIGLLSLIVARGRR